MPAARTPIVTSPGPGSGTSVSTSASTSRSPKSVATQRFAMRSANTGLVEGGQHRGHEHRVQHGALLNGPAVAWWYTSVEVGKAARAGQADHPVDPAPRRRCASDGSGAYPVV